MGAAPGSLPAAPRIRTAAAERANRYSEAYAFNVQQPRLPGVQVSHSKRNPETVQSTCMPRWDSVRYPCPMST